MRPEYDPELEKELREKTYNYNEVFSIIEHTLNKTKKNKYITVFLAGLWSPAITLLCWLEYQHPVILLTGAVTSTFIAYLSDETHLAIRNHILRKIKKNDPNRKN
jgi:hypothetical protein